MAQVIIKMGEIVLDLNENDKTSEDLLQLGTAYIFTMYDKAVQTQLTQEIPDDDSDEGSSHPVAKQELKPVDVLQSQGMFA